MQTTTPSVSAAFAGYVDTHDIISFDVFDTLIFRAIDAPTDIFALVRGKLLTSWAALIHADAIDAFPELRVRAERRARADKTSREASDEVTFDEIYEAFARLSGAPPNVIDLLKRTEIETEHDVVYADPDAARLFAFARAAGKPVVLCSDMYLPAAVVRSLLRRCGYDGYDELYVSCEHARSKYAGTLFACVIEKYGVPAERVLHIGDDAHGDVVMARRAGCTALHVPHARRAAQLGSQDGAGLRSDDLVSAIIAGLTRKHDACAEAAAADPWEEIGFRVFGPLFTGFLLWLQSAIETKRPDRVLLFARDTYWIQAYWERFVGRTATSPPTHYAYVSRGALLLASMTDFPLARLDHLFSGRARQSLSHHMRRLGIDVRTLDPVVRSAGFTSVDDVVNNGDPRMRDLLGKLAHPLLRESARRRPLVQDYLARLVGDAKDVMLVDIGWVGNMQASFVRLLASQRPAMSVRGYYVGLFSSAADNVIPGHTMHGWLTRPDDPRQTEHTMWWSGGVELLEFAMTAPHGTTLGYERRSDGTAEPVLESSVVECETADLARRVQRGATAFVDDFLATYGGVSPEGLSSRAWGLPFHRLVTVPSAADAELLGDITHSDSAGGTAVRLALAPQITGSRSAGDELASCYWTSGFIVRNRLDGDDSFTESLYRTLNPDVRAALEAGAIESGYQHWVEHGRNEGRLSSWAGLMRRQRDSS